MHSPTLSCVGLAVAGLLTVSLPAQEVAAPAPDWVLGSQPVDGSIPGTKRYNVTFNDRSFTLDELRIAIAQGRTADDVDRIVARMQAMANEQRAGFRQRIEAMGG